MPADQNAAILWDLRHLRLHIITSVVNLLFIGFGIFLVGIGVAAIHFAEFLGNTIHHILPVRGAVPNMRIVFAVVMIMTVLVMILPGQQILLGNRRRYRKLTVALGL